MAQYRTTPGAGYTNDDAQIIGERLEQLPKVTPAAVVQDAAAADSPLHPFFEWRDDVAAYQYRLFQARNIVNHLTVVITTPDGGKETKAYHSLRIESAEPDGEEDQDNRVYVDVTTVRHETQLREQVIANALKELHRWQERYAEYSDVLSPVFEAIESLTVV